MSHKAHVILFLDTTKSPPVAKRAIIASEYPVEQHLMNEAQLEVFSVEDETYADALDRARTHINEPWWAWIKPLIGWWYLG